MNERSGRTRKTRKLARMTARAVAGATLLAVATVAAASAASADRDPGFQSGTLRISFVDARGVLQKAPYFDLTNVYPGMPAERTTVTLRNTGTLVTDYSVSAANVRPSGRHSLDDVLLVTVTDRASGRALYSGKLSGLSFRGSEPLAPGESASYAIQVTWPDPAADANPYQGRSLGFDLRADARTSAL